MVLLEAEGAPTDVTTPMLLLPLATTEPLPTLLLLLPPATTSLLFSLCDETLKKQQQRAINVNIL